MWRGIWSPGICYREAAAVESIIKNGRQLCEIRSLTDRHCVHKWHRLPGEPGDGPIMTHNSRSRTLATSNCGRMQVQSYGFHFHKSAIYVTLF